MESSLDRLGLERLPLYMAHDFDPDTPQEETLATLDELVREGKIGAVGASNFTAAQLAEAVEISALEGLTRYEWVQNSYSLLDCGDGETIFSSATSTVSATKRSARSREAGSPAATGAARRIPRGRA